MLGTMTQSSMYISPQDPFPNLQNVKLLIQNKQLNHLCIYIHHLERKRFEIFGIDPHGNGRNESLQKSNYRSGTSKLKGSQLSHFIAHSNSINNHSSSVGGVNTWNLSSRFRETNLQISLNNLSQNWNQYNISANWSSILLNIHNPQMIHHILYNILPTNKKPMEMSEKQERGQVSQHSVNQISSQKVNVTTSSTLNSVHSSPDSNQASQVSTASSRTSSHSSSSKLKPTVNIDRKRYFWLFDSLEQLIQLLSCGCEGNSCVGITKSMPQLIYGMHLGVHHWIFDSIHSFNSIITAYKSQLISIKDILKPILRITIHLENKYQQFGLNVKYQENEIREILTLCHSYGVNLFGVVLDLSPEEEAMKNQKSIKSTAIAQMRRGFRYLEIVCEACERLNVGIPSMVFVRAVGSPSPDDMFTVHCESARYSMNQAIWEALQNATGKFSNPTSDIDSWLQPLQELTLLSKQWKDPENRILLVADPTQFLLCNTHSLSVKIISVYKKELPKPMKVVFYGSQQGATSDFQPIKSKIRYTHFQELHLTDGVGFLFQLKLRGIFFKPFVEKQMNNIYSPLESNDSTIVNLPSGTQGQPNIEIIPTVIYGDLCHYDSLDCLNPIVSPSKYDEPVFFALPPLTELDKIRFEGLGPFEHLYSRHVLETRERKYSTIYIHNSKSKL